MRKLPLSLVIGLMLLMTVVLPSFLFMVFHASSFAAGVVLVSLLYVFLFVAMSAIGWRSQRQGISAFLITAVMGVVMIQGMVSFLINDDFDFGRFSQSFLVLIIYFLGAFSFALLSQKVTKFQTIFSVRLVFYVLLLSSIAGIVDFSPFSSEWVKPVFFFTEPSSFALSFLPFLLYTTVTSNPRMKLLFVLLSYAIALLLENLTLVVGITLIAGLAVPLRRFLFLAPIAVILTFPTVMNLDYYSSRVDISSDSQNLSTLVYLSGWERAYQNVEATFGLGVGFQQFGIIGSRGELMESIRGLSGGDLNSLDGGAVAPKLIGELGLLGVAMLLAYLVYFAKSAKWLREVSMGKVAPREHMKVFFFSCFVMYCIDFFIRGTGYFSSSGFFFVTSLVWVANAERSDKVLYPQLLRRCQQDSLKENIVK